MTSTDRDDDCARAAGHCKDANKQQPSPAAELVARKRLRKEAVGRLRLIRGSIMRRSKAYGYRDEQFVPWRGYWLKASIINTACAQV
jgi:hypothetical protein